MTTVRSVLTLFVKMDGNANDSGASQDILSGQNVDSRLSALETSMVSIQQGLNAILQAQTLVISQQPQVHQRLLFLGEAQSTPLPLFR